MVRYNDVDYETGNLDVKTVFQDNSNFYSYLKKVKEMKIGENIHSDWHVHRKLSLFSSRFYVGYQTFPSHPELDVYRYILKKEDEDTEYLSKSRYSISIESRRINHLLNPKFAGTSFKNMFGILANIVGLRPKKKLLEFDNPETALLALGLLEKEAKSKTPTVDGYGIRDSLHRKPHFDVPFDGVLNDRYFARIIDVYASQELQQEVMSCLESNTQDFARLDNTMFTGSRNNYKEKLRVNDVQKLVF